MRYSMQSCIESEMYRFWDQKREVRRESRSFVTDQAENMDVVVHVEWEVGSVASVHIPSILRVRSKANDDRSASRNAAIEILRE